MKHYCGTMELEVRPACDSINEGLLWYNYTGNLLYKCKNSLWIILKNEHQSSNSNECKGNMM